MKMILAELQSNMKEAMIANDKTRLTVIKEIIGEAKNIAISKRRDITEEDINDAIIKMHKICKEQVETCPENRVENLIVYKKRLEVVESYMPKQLDENEIKEFIDKMISEKNITSVKDAMKTIMPELKGKADGKLVSKIIRESFGG